MPDFIAALNDPVADRANWTADISRHSNFRTHTLVKQSQHRIAILPSRATTRSLYAFVLVGNVLFGFGAYFLGLAARDQGGFILPGGLIAIGGIFSGLGVAALCLNRRHVFDTDVSVYLTGTKPVNKTESKQHRNRIRLDQIHAIQLLSKRVYSLVSKNPGKSPPRWGFSHNNYELNLVLQDGSRVAVVDYGDVEGMKADAGRLAEFLNVAGWDATRIESRTIYSNRGLFGRFKRFWRRAQGGAQVGPESWH